MLSFFEGMLRRVIWLKFTDLSEDLTTQWSERYALMLKAVTASEYSISFYETIRLNIAKYSHMITGYHSNKCEDDNLVGYWAV